MHYEHSAQASIRTEKIMTSKFMIPFVLCAFLLVGCGSVVPPGETVIIRKPSGETKVVNEGVYRGVGRDRVYFIDNKLQAFEEDMQILCTDEINMYVDVKALLSFDVDDTNIDYIQEKIPANKNRIGLAEFYRMAIRPIVRSSARSVVSTYVTDDIRPNRDKIQAEIDRLVRDRIDALNFPLEVSGILISNIDYPKIVTAQRQAIKTAQLEDERRSAIAEAQIAQAQREVAIETENAKVRMIRAQAQADENAILTSSLTPQFLLWRQMEMLESVGPNTNMMLVPYQAITPEFMNTVMVRDALETK